MVRMKRQSHSAKVQERATPYGARVAETVCLPAELLDVGVRYMNELREKARLVSTALRNAGVRHAVIGGLAVAAHVARVDPAAQRNTQDLDILLHRDEFDAAKRALDGVGYKHRHVKSIDAFLPKDRKASLVEGVHVIWAGEKVRADYVAAAPVLELGSNYAGPDGVEYLGLVELLTMKLTSYRHKDITHVQDLMEQKLVTKKVEAALVPELRARLEQVKDDTKREALG
jgi:Uncharacterised nucleotidyltransferase